jgi:hypothetical protein
MSVSTLAQRRAMAPLALQERIEMSTAEIPYAAPITVVVRRSCKGCVVNGALVPIVKGIQGCCFWCIVCS